MSFTSALLTRTGLIRRGPLGPLPKGLGLPKDGENAEKVDNSKEEEEDEEEDH